MHAVLCDTCGALIRVQFGPAPSAAGLPCSMLYGLLIVDEAAQC